MNRPIVKDPIILSQISAPATKNDLSIAFDLLDTLKAHQEECVGLAANMIGELKRIIVFWNEEDGIPCVMMNPVLSECKEPYETEEGCLSLPGVRATKRYRRITVSYRDMSFAAKRRIYEGFTAQIIQHEVDMLNGILI